MNWRETGNPNVIRTDCFLCDDISGHLYIYLASETPNGFCFKCQTFFSKRRLEKAFDCLPKSSEDITIKSLDQAINMLRGFVEKGLPVTDLPESIPALEDKRSRSYLRQRQIPEYLSLRHNLRFCTEGQYRSRIIIPVYFKKRICTFVARDITGNKAKKYLFPPGVNSGSLLFNFDNIRGKMVVVVEGVFDALHLQRFHIPAVASFGKKLTLAQQELLQCFEKVIFTWDADALAETHRYMRALSQSTAVTLSKGDPTNFSGGELIKMLQHQLGKLDIAAKVLRR